MNRTGQKRALIVVDSERHCVELVLEAGVRRLVFESRNALVHAQTSPYSPHLVVLTERGALEIRSLHAPARVIQSYDVGAIR